jgi:hypothetical protein
MAMISIADEMRRQEVKRRRDNDDQRGAWIAQRPVLSDICRRLIEFDPILGSEDPADETAKRVALDAAVAARAVTWSEIEMLDAALQRTRELFPLSGE